MLTAVMGLSSLYGAKELMAGPIATGSGWLAGQGPKRTFAFTAVEQEDGSVSGQAQVNGPGIHVHIAIDCAVTDEVSGDLGMSGVITKSSEGGPPVGWIAFFAVRDNGNGKPDPDQITIAGALPAGTLVELFGQGFVDYLSDVFGEDVSQWPMNCDTYVQIENKVSNSAVYDDSDFLPIGGGSITEH